MSLSCSRRTLLLALGVVFMTSSGCGQKSPPVFPTYSSPPATVTQNPGPASQIIQIGKQISDSVGSSLVQVQFTPRQSKTLEATISPFILQVQTALQSPCQLQFSVSNPFAPSQSNLGLALLGRVLSWRILDDLTTQNGDDAIQMFLLGTKLGFLLDGGDAQDAIIGDQIADAVRKALMTNLLSLGASQLESLASGVQSVLAERPPRSVTVQNEAATLMNIVETIQDSTLQGKQEDMARILGPSARLSLSALVHLQSENSASQINFFTHLANQAKQQSSWLEANANFPTSKRAAPLKYKVTAAAPWKELAAYLMTTGNSWLQVDDATLARTRLLILYCLLEVQIKTGHAPPPTLSVADTATRTDPFTGKPFFYVPSQHGFLLYSAGENGLDDGGSTDPTFTYPDLFLENTR